MAFFQSTPNLPFDGKARIEFHLQQISECIGFDRLNLRVLNEHEVLLGGSQSEYRSANQIMATVGDHLDHNVADIKLQTLPLPPEQSGGGG